MHPTNSSRSILLTALILGWLADFFFYGKSPGISVLLFTLLLLATLIGLGRREGIFPFRPSLAMIGPIIFLAAMVFVRANLFVTLLNLVATLALLGLLAHFYAAGRLTRLGLLGYPAVLVETGLNALIRPAPLVSRSANLESVRKQGRRNVLPLARGLALAVPVLAVFTCFLASADLVFASYVEDVFNLEFLRNIFEWLWRGIIILIIAWLLAGGLAYAFSRRQAKTGESVAENVAHKLGAIKFLGFFEVTTVLILVDLLFLVFVAIQFTYLFGGRANIAIEGYTYAEYARRGFFELLAVSVLSLGLILGLHRLGRRQSAGQVALFNGLSSLMIGLVLVILASAFQRLLLYEAAFGYTELRLYSHILMVWLAVVFIWFLATLWWRPAYFAMGVFVVAVGFVVTLNIINPDAFIARQNLARYQATGKLDAYYLTTLSDDVASVLVFALPFVEGEPRETLETHLAQRRARLKQRLDEQSWVSFHLAQQQAYYALDTLPLD